MRTQNTTLRVSSQFRADRSGIAVGQYRVALPLSWQRVLFARTTALRDGRHQIDAQLEAIRVSGRGRA
jgi:hypothetical protein